MSTFTSSLLRVDYNGRCSYIKAVQHLGHNICDRTLEALDASSLYLHETCLKMVERGARERKVYGTEYLLSKKLMNKSCVHLDSICDDLNWKLSNMYPVTAEQQGKLAEKYQTFNPVTDRDLAEIIITFESEEMQPEYYDLLIVQRNKRWMKIIVPYLERGESCFILCGAAHVNDLVVRLEKVGCKISRVSQGNFATYKRSAEATVNLKSQNSKAKEC